MTDQERPEARAQEIENLMMEGRTFPPDPAFVARANAGPSSMRARRRTTSASGPKPPARPCSGTSRSRRPSTWELPFAKLVRGRQAERLARTASTATSRPGSGTRSHITGSASPATPGRSRSRTSIARSEGRERAARARHRDRRPRRDLHADDPRAADRDAGLRPHRCAPHGGLRRLLGRGALCPHQRRRGQARHHRGRRLAPRQAGRR